MSRGRDYPDSGLFHDVLSPLQESGSDGPRGAPRDAQGGKRQSPSDPPHRLGGRCFSCEGVPKASSKRLVVTPTE
ncbi:hypothetical protein BHE74_00030549 [Ensete ventricosum]|nr:hypothetical protein BHE74_00030549 [Ensete ventricosum]